MPSRNRYRRVLHFAISLVLLHERLACASFSDADANRIKRRVDAGVEWQFGVLGRFSAAFGTPKSTAYEPS
jgi:hypothetical protein